MNLDGHKLAGASVITMLSGLAAQDITETGQIVSILVSIISGVVSLIKLLRRKK